MTGPQSLRSILMACGKLPNLAHDGGEARNAKGCIKGETVEWSMQSMGAVPGSQECTGIWSENASRVIAYDEGRAIGTQMVGVSYFRIEVAIECLHQGHELRDEVDIHLKGGLIDTTADGRCPGVDWIDLLGSVP